MREVERPDRRERPIGLPLIVEIRDEVGLGPSLGAHEGARDGRHDGAPDDARGAPSLAADAALRAPALTVLRGGQEPLAAYGASHRRRRTQIAVQVAAGPARLATTRYRWDADTGILVARLATAVGRASLADEGAGRGRAGAVELEGPDGSWVTLDLRGGRICGLQIAVWPRIRRRLDLALPADATAGEVAIAGGAGAAAEGSGGTGIDLEVDTDLTVDADPAGGLYHLRIGAPRAVRVVRVGRDMLVDVDGAGELAGVWIAAVPPRPLPS